MGQLVNLIRARYVIPALPLNKVKGQPFNISEITAAIDAVLGGK
jgi:hypothetical protein